MEQVLTILGTIASLGAIPLGIYFYLKTKESKFDKVRKEIVKILSYQIGEEREITAFEIQTVINSKIRENRFKANTISIDEIVEDLVTETISSPLIDRNRKKIILANLKNIYVKDEILNNIDIDAKKNNVPVNIDVIKDEILGDIDNTEKDNLTWENLESKMKDFINSKQEVNTRANSLEKKGKSYERISTWFAIITAIITIFGVVLSFVNQDSFENLFEQINQNKEIAQIVLALVTGLIASLFAGLVITLRKRIQRKDKSQSRIDTFFETRKDEETFDDIVKSNPKSIKYSGGNMRNLIPGMMDSECFKNYITNNIDVKVQFLFPDTNNTYVIENLVNNVTVGNRTDIYIASIKDAINKLSDFIEKYNLQDRVEYRFYQFVPSFGLQIIEEGKNDRLYVDLFTIGIPKDSRYRFKIEKEKSPETYIVFKNQFNKLWDISQNASR